LKFFSKNSRRLFWATAIIYTALTNGIKGAVIAGVAAEIANGIGNMGNNMIKSGTSAFVVAGTKAVLHGITRAAISKAQGGRWSSGFWSGFASSYLAPISQRYGGVSRVVSSAIVGGTVSSVSGGKFANGAVAGAFIMMYNDMAEHGKNYISKNNMSYNETEALSNESFRVRFTLSDEQFRNEMGFEGDSLRIYNAKNKLRAQFLTGGVLQGIQRIGRDSLSVTIPTNSNTIGFIKKFTSIFIGTKSNYGFDYNCNNASTCSFKGMYAK